VLHFARQTSSINIGLDSAAQIPIILLYPETNIHCFNSFASSSQCLQKLQ